MGPLTPLSLSAMHDLDETGWLEHTADLLRTGRLGDVEAGTLAEYLTDMANRDRREVFSRFVTLLTHLLKWDYQPQGRGTSWRGTIREQRRELRLLLESGTLRNHAEAIFADTYQEAREQAADETGLETADFPVTNPWTVDSALNGGEIEPVS